MKKLNYPFWAAFFTICFALFLVCKKEKEIVVTPVLRLVQLCDPQLRVPGISYELSVSNFERAIQLVNEITPDVLLICGDMVHYYDRDEDINKFLEIISRVKVPFLLNPGNHDMDEPLTLEGLQRYRSFFGEDFQTKELKGYSIISANSLLLWPGAGPKEENLKHSKRLNEALQSAQSKNQPIVMITHYTPVFGEPGNEIFGLPKQFADLVSESGGFVWLAGHWHQAERRTYKNITILVGEASSVNMGSPPTPPGIRLITVWPDNRIDWDYIPLY